MKVAITGHTSGIGLSLAEKFLENKCEVVGFSRSNGFDIGNEAHRMEILNKIDDCDAFINNAFHDDGQLKLLEGVMKRWEGANKHVVNISSVIVLMPENNFVQWPKVHSYRSAKLNLNNFARNYKGSVRLLNVLPGIVKTNFYLIDENPEAMVNAMDVSFVTDKIINVFFNEGYATKQIVISKATQGL